MVTQIGAARATPRADVWVPAAWPSVLCPASALLETTLADEFCRLVY